LADHLHGYVWTIDIIGENTMLGLLRDKLPTRWHVYLFPAYKAARKRIEQLDRVLDRRQLPETQLIDLLRELGFTPGATVMVHSAFSPIKRRVPNITPERLIRLLQELLGPEGTLLMPTFAFRGRQSHYIDTHSSFDVQNTPSAVGILTEVFRKMPGVIRSHHPTHAVAGWGRNARELLSTHHLGETFGVTSPFYRLREFDGLVVGLGRRYRYAFTITHVPEELNPISRKIAFDERRRSMNVIDGDREFTYECRVLRPGLPREYERISRIMRKEHILRYVTRSGLPCAVTRADPFLRKAMQLADENNYILKAPRSFATQVTEGVR
jgi:aminoglycoside N3'-acetyltransferase